LQARGGRQLAQTQAVDVKILDAAGPTGGCSCGSATAGGTGYTQMVQNKCRELREALEGKFPGRTSVEYRNLVEHPEERDTPAGQLLVKRTFPPPLVVIDGEARFAGSIQVAKIVEAVGARLGS
jgi:hypothetical protein